MKVNRLEALLILVRLYRYTVDYNGTTVYERSELYSPQIAQFTLNPFNSTANVLRDVMFLDEVDLLVVGTVEGNELSNLTDVRQFSWQWICCPYPV
jgi:hypothetical protein